MTRRAAVRRMGMRRGAFLPFLLLVAVVAGCGLIPAGAPDPVGSPVECLGVPQGMCDQVISEAGRQAIDQRAVLVQIRIRCTSPTGCTEQSGELEYEAILSNGTRLGSSGFGWAAAAPAPMPVPAEPAKPGAPGWAPVGPPVEPICIGIDRASCRVMARDSFGGEEPPDRVVSIVVTCDAVCTPQRGSGTTLVTFANGETLNGSWSYEGVLGG